MDVLLSIAMLGVFSQCGNSSCAMCYGSYWLHSTPAERSYYYHVPSALVTDDATTHYQASDKHPWSFAKAEAKRKKENCPLLIMVSAAWCKECQRVKREILPKAQANGTFDDVAFAVIDYDLEGRLRRQVMKGQEDKALPRWVRYEYFQGRLFRWSTTFAPKTLEGLDRFVNRSIEPEVQIRMMIQIDKEKSIPKPKG